MTAHEQRDPVAARVVVLAPFTIVAAVLVVALAAFEPSWWSLVPLALLVTISVQAGLLIERTRRR